MDCPFRASQFLRTANNSLRSAFFKGKTANPQPAPKLSLLLVFHSVGHSLLALITPGPGTRKLGTLLCLRAHWNYSNSPTPNLLSRPHLFLPQEVTVEALAHISPSPRPPDRSWCFLCGRAWCVIPPPLGIVSTRNFFSNGHYIPTCWPYYTPHFLSIHYILKHRDANIQVGKSPARTLTVVHVLPQALCTEASYVF